VQQRLTKETLSFLCARWTKPTRLAAKRQKEFVPTFTASNPDEAVVHQSTFEKLIDDNLMPFSQSAILGLKNILMKA
jgi:hypothetical protein